MKVKPYKASRNLRDDSARIIIANYDAVEELLRETLVENMCSYFNLNPSADLLYELYWDQQREQLIFTVLTHKNLHQKRNKINQIINESKKTTDSFFKKCCYRIVTLKTD